MVMLNTSLLNTTSIFNQYQNNSYSFTHTLFKLFAQEVRFKTRIF